ncbi:hypothetical protein FOH37_05630 [Salmonella enterica]|nr:hypothetical protein [Salmonella enterica]
MMRYKEQESVMKLKPIPFYLLALFSAASSDVQICSRQICRSPQSHNYLCSWGFTPLPPLSNSNYFG